MHAIGVEAVKIQSVELVGLSDVVRSGPGLVFASAGMLMLAVTANLIAIDVWRSGRYQKWYGIPLAVGFSLYIPQLFMPQYLRVAHGFIVASGSIWLAVNMWAVV